MKKNYSMSTTKLHDFEKSPRKLKIFNGTSHNIDFFNTNQLIGTRNSPIIKTGAKPVFSISNPQPLNIGEIPENWYTYDIIIVSRHYVNNLNYSLYPNEYILKLFLTNNCVKGPNGNTVGTLGIITATKIESANFPDLKISNPLIYCLIREHIANNPREYDIISRVRNNFTSY